MKNLIVAAFAAALSLTALDGGSSFAVAQECKPVPTVTAGQTQEVYSGSDAALIRATQGAPQGDTFVIILDTGKDGNGYRSGMIYAVDKDGCVVAANEVYEESVIKFFNLIGVTRKVSTPK